MYLMYNDEKAKPDCSKDRPPSTDHGHTKGIHVRNVMAVVIGPFRHGWTIFFGTAYELRHDKTNKMSVCPAKTQISLGIRPV